MNLIDLFTTLGVWSILVAGSAFVAREAIKRWMDKSVERFKHDLSRAATEHSVRFSHLHDRRALALYRIHASLGRAVAALDMFTRPIQHGTDIQRKRAEEANIAITRLSRHVHDSAILMPAALATQLRSLVKRLDEMWFDAFIRFEEVNGPEPDGNRREAYRVIHETWKALKAEVPPILEALESEFRTLLGVQGTDKEEVAVGTRKD